MSATTQRSPIKRRLVAANETSKAQTGFFLGIAYMERRLAPRPIANVRMVSAQPEGSGGAWRRFANRIEG